MDFAAVKSRFHRAAIVAGMIAVSSAIALAQVGGGVSNTGGLPQYGAWGGAPTYSAGCGGSVTLGSQSNMYYGTITYGASGGSCTLLWAAARVSAPTCFFQQTGGTASTITVAATATQIVVTNSTVGTLVGNYLCIGT